MKPSLLASVLSILIAATASAHYINFSDPTGESVHPKQFNLDYAAAQEKVTELKSAQPFLDMLKEYHGAAEIAELEYTLGLIYGQRTGVVDVEKSVIHFTKALEYRLPAKAYIDALMLRGGASEQGKDYRAALDDYLRGLLACSDYDLTGGWPKEASPAETWDHRSREPAELQKARDYRIYREKIRMKQHVMRQRFYFVEAVKRATKLLTRDDVSVDLKKDLSRLSPDDPKRFNKILKRIKAENPKPWP